MQAAYLSLHFGQGLPRRDPAAAVSGALLQIGQPSLAITIVAAVAILLATINVFGGFAVTRRMLGMFAKGHDHS